ncbi:MFS transporter [Kitasatospora sp. NA04385]|uniref:MFS transporter n=1 Tax=Kitasatospora sp. NA04385 TaxID=2742135 RepID=UPI001591182B|nr:MFS transporter [Kitasatospora sp. NA04385]
MGYAALLRAPHVARLLLGTLLGRLPAGMTALVIALALREAGTPYSRIGLATAAYAIAAAVGGPVLGRIVDLTGQPRVLLASAALAGTGYALLALAPGSALAAPLGAAVAGLCMPPLEPCLRSLWPDVVAEEQLDTAYAFDSASQQVLYVAGPLAVAGIAGALSPTAALWTAAVLGLLGALVVAGSAPARAWQAPPRAASAGLLGPLRSPGWSCCCSAWPAPAGRSAPRTCCSSRTPSSTPAACPAAPGRCSRWPPSPDCSAPWPTAPPAGGPTPRPAPGCSPSAWPPATCRCCSCPARGRWPPSPSSPAWAWPRCWPPPSSWSPNSPPPAPSPRPSPGWSPCSPPATRPATRSPAPWSTPPCTPSPCAPPAASPSAASSCSPPAPACAPPPPHRCPSPPDPAARATRPPDPARPGRKALVRGGRPLLGCPA